MTGRGAAGLLLARAFAEHPELDAEARLTRFLAEHWHRRALLIPQALRQFDVPLDADELAGLACEPDADARIVRRTSRGFESEAGPFSPERFASLGERDWTLLVNGVDLAIPGFEALLEAVRFLPDWRLDDIMISFAAPGGSVGPHHDRYDVFLLQAAGVRRWELGAVPDGDQRPQRLEGGLSLVADFLPDARLRCEPGDVLYVPPGLVHHGIAETACLTISVGLRAPSLRDLVTDWALTLVDELAAQTDDRPLDLDPELPAAPASLAPETLEKARRLLSDAVNGALLDEARFAGWLGCALTRPGRSSFQAPEADLSTGDLAAELSAGAVLQRAPGLRLLLHPAAHGTEVFAGGFRLHTPLPVAALEAFTSFAPLDRQTLAAPEALRLAQGLYTAGLLELVDGDEAS
ncbi:MAG: cupin domain-containing protein [Pseudomonadales bacterium]|jgi:50S ribosomal protein L16 3-hydroxylase|nr:cupin domain-containing protein [Pseudomonadales bacterium]